jgi:GNAT superfamily N-acetyltransferase
MHAIRLATMDDLPKLAAVERSAATAFRDVNLAWVADGETLNAACLVAMYENRMLWVAVDATDAPIGFLAAQLLDKQVYIAELSVILGYQRKGFGKALITVAIASVRSKGANHMTLITYRDVVWNGPFYTRLGFAEVEAASLGPGHMDMLLDDAAAGHDPSRRCVMAKSVRNTT